MIPQRIWSFDMGSSNCRIYYLAQGKTPQPVALTIFDQSRHCLPAALRMDGERIISCGVNAYEMESHKTLHDNFKLCIGNHETVDFANIFRRYSHAEALLYTEKLLAILLERLWEEKPNSKESNNLFCFTHPVHWVESEALNDFKQMVVRLFLPKLHQNIYFIPEPEAALVSLLQTGQLKAIAGYILVIDIGGGTTDIVAGRWTKEKEGFQEMRHFGCDRGGSHIDNCVANYIAQKLQLPALRSDALNQQLRAYGRNFKESISQQARINHHQPVTLMVVLATEEDCLIRQNISLTCDEFEKITQDIMIEMKQSIMQALEKMELDAYDIGQVVLVGGGARLYLLPNILREVFDTSVPVIYGDPPDSTVARGAALWLLRSELEMFADTNAEKAKLDSEANIHIQLIESKKAKSQAYKIKGAEKIRHQDYQGAIADFTQAIAIDPDNIAAYFNRGAANYQLQNYTKAIKDWSQVVNMNPNDAYASYQIGMAFIKREEYPEAILNFNQALLINPQLADAYLERGIAYYFLGNRENAVEDIKQAMQFSPTGVSDRQEKLKKSIGFFTPSQKKREIESLVEIMKHLLGKKPKDDPITVLIKALKVLIPEPEVIPVLTDRAAIEYFVTDRPALPTVKKGAILRQVHPKRKAYIVSQVFLSESNEIVCRSDGSPYGRKLIVKSFDEELLEAFHDKDLIIFE